MRSKLAVDGAVFHDEGDAGQTGDVVQRIAWHGDDVGVFALADGADVLVDLHHHGWPVGGGADGVHGRHAELVHPDVESTELRDRTFGDGV